MKNILPWFIIVFSLVGIFDAGYLTWQKLNHLIPPCNSAFECESVLNSKWAQIGPVPLSVFGLIFYTSFLILGSMLFLGREELTIGSSRLPLRVVVGLWGMFGALFSVYLVIIMGLVIEAWCLYCLLSAFTSLVLFCLSSLVFITFKKDIKEV